jgi:uncharacterized membrane protein
MGRQRKGHLTGTAGLVVVAMAVGAFLLATRSAGPACTAVRGSGTLEINVRNLAPGSAEVFCYRDSAGKRLRFVLARSTKGKVYAAFDACRECYMHRAGYSAHNGYLMCRTCGTRYRIDHMRTGKASCVPVALPVAEHGNKVDVSVKALEKGRWLF